MVAYTTIDTVNYHLKVVVSSKDIVRQIHIFPNNLLPFEYFMLIIIINYTINKEIDIYSILDYYY